MPKSSGHLPIVLLPKTCSRCGRAFGALGREYTCPSCRRPAHRQRKAATSHLSFRERQIVQLIQAAKSNKEIAYELALTVGTVKEYLFHIFRKLGVSNRTELALWGARRSAALNLNATGKGGHTVGVHVIQSA